MRIVTAVVGQTQADDVNVVILAALPEIVGSILFSGTHG